MTLVKIYNIKAVKLSTTDGDSRQSFVNMSTVRPPGEAYLKLKPAGRSPGGKSVQIQPSRDSR